MQSSRIVKGINPAVGAVIAVKARVKGTWCQLDVLDLRVEFDVVNICFLLPMAFSRLVSAGALEMDGPSGFLDTHPGECGSPSGGDNQQQEANKPKQRIGPNRIQHGNPAHRPNGVNRPAEHQPDGAPSPPDQQGDGRPCKQGKNDGKFLNYNVARLNPIMSRFFEAVWISEP